MWPVGGPALVIKIPGSGHGPVGGPDLVINLLGKWAESCGWDHFSHICHLSLVMSEVLSLLFSVQKPVMYLFLPHSTELSLLSLASHSSPMWHLFPMPSILFCSFLARHDCNPSPLGGSGKRTRSLSSAWVRPFLQKGFPSPLSGSGLSWDHKAELVSGRKVLHTLGGRVLHWTVALDVPKGHVWKTVPSIAPGRQELSGAGAS